MKLALCVFFLAIGVCFVAAQGPFVQIFGNATGRPLDSKLVLAPPSANKTQTRWAVYRGHKALRGIRHENFFNLKSNATIFSGGIGLNATNVTVTSSPGKPIFSKITFY